MQLLHTEFCTTALTIFLVTGLGNESLHHRLTFCPVIFVSKSCASKGCPNSPPLALLSLPTLMLDPLILSMLSVWAKWYEYGMNQARSNPPGHCIGKLGILLALVAIYLTVSVLVLYKLGTSPLNVWLSCHELERHCILPRKLAVCYIYQRAENLGNSHRCSCSQYTTLP